VATSAEADFKHRMGRPPLEQLMHITGRQVKYLPGLPTPLQSATDKALDQPQDFQPAIDLILSILRESGEPVTLFSTGSCRDFAVAFNRDPALFKRKVKAVYCVAGTVVDRGDVLQDDFNVTLDPWAFFRMFDLSVPLYWCGTRPKQSERAPGGLYSTSFWIHEEAVIRAGIPPVQNYFIYALSKSKDDPLKFLESGFQRIPRARAFAGDGGRFMWSTGPLCHAAGRNIYRKGLANFVSLSPGDAKQAGLLDHQVEPFDFVPVTVTPKQAPNTLTLDFKTSVPNPHIFAFRRPVADIDYKTIMELVLTNVIAELGRPERKK
jgi:hypothetical protein